MRLRKTELQGENASKSGKDSEVGRNNTKGKDRPEAGGDGRRGPWGGKTKQGRSAHEATLEQEWRGCEGQHASRKSQNLKLVKRINEKR